MIDGSSQFDRQIAGTEVEKVWVSPQQSTLSGVIMIAVSEGNVLSRSARTTFLPNDVERMPNALLKPGINSSARHCSGRSRELHCDQKLQWPDIAGEVQRIANMAPLSGACRR